METPHLRFEGFNNSLLHSCFIEDEANYVTFERKYFTFLFRFLEIKYFWYFTFLKHCSCLRTE